MKSVMNKTIGVTLARETKHIGVVNRIVMVLIVLMVLISLLLFTTLHNINESYADAPLSVSTKIDSEGRVIGLDGEPIINSWVHLEQENEPIVYVKTNDMGEIITETEDIQVAVKDQIPSMVNQQSTGKLTVKVKGVPLSYTDDIKLSLYNITQPDTVEYTLTKIKGYKSKQIIPTGEYTLQGTQDLVPYQVIVKEFSDPKFKTKELKKDDDLEIELNFEGVEVVQDYEQRKKELNSDPNSNLNQSKIIREELEHMRNQGETVNDKAIRDSYRIDEDKDNIKISNNVPESKGSNVAKVMLGFLLAIIILASLLYRRSSKATEILDSTSSDTGVENDGNINIGDTTNLEEDIDIFKEDNF